MNEAVEGRQNAPQFMVLILVASSYFENYLDKGVGLLTPAKILGALALGVWGAAWLLRRCSVIWNRQMTVLVGFGLAILISWTAAIDSKAALQESIRYLSFFLLFFLIVQTIAGDMNRAIHVIDAAVVGAVASAVVGLLIFARVGGRARGPLDDPNDFGFMLATAIPLIAYRIRTLTSRRLRGLAIAGLVVVAACAAATFSRGALVGVAAALGWLAVTGRIRVRWIVIAGVVAGIAAVGALRIPTVKTALEQKQYIAGDNVSARLTAWDVAYREWRLSPIIGVGVGNYLDRYWEFDPLPTSGTTHDAYLHILAETGLGGIGFFLAFLALGWLNVRRRARGPDDGVGVLRTYLAASFLTALVGSVFLTEQFYSPLWLFPAIAAGLVVTRIVAGIRPPAPARHTPAPVG
jgi:putative inorganic carbon (HCO3(-)) transporter